MSKTGPGDGTNPKQDHVALLRVAIVNDYEVIVAGLMAMLLVVHLLTLLGLKRDQPLRF